MRIIAIVGVWNFQTLSRLMWPHFETAFKKQFPRASFSVEHLWYSPWQGEKMRRFADSIVEKYDDGEEDILLLGHSMGGVIATAIASRFTKARVVQVVTVFSPHKFLGGIFPRMLRSRRTNVPVVSCSALLDWIVLWGARHPDAVRHARINCDHLFGLLLSKGPAEKIAKAAKL
ncbi:hypothetical protein H7X87_00735 [Acetobacteraceae bacterium]|nr:hypothetical protein [Candidatus Parcubacteria bacterium]